MTDEHKIDPMDLIANDRAMQAKRETADLPDGDPVRAKVEELTAHTASQEAYQDYYKTMRGGICPEDRIFRRHEEVKRFAKIRELILERKHKTVLDLGCLDGWQLLNLAASGIKGVGVDLCPKALEVAKERAKKWGFDLAFIQSSIEEFDAETDCQQDSIWYQRMHDWYDAYGKGYAKGKPDAPPYPMHFDAVIISEVLEHVLDPVACMKTAAKHLAPGGIVYVSVPATPIPHHGKLEDAREHLRIYSEQDIIDVAKAAGLHRVVDHEIIPEQDQGVEFANRTISFRRATVSISCGHVTGGWSPLQEDSLGGSEEIVVKVAESWARQGHDVTVYKNGPDGGQEINGVVYLSRDQVPKADQDVLILFKSLEQMHISANVKIFWTTDLPNPGTGATFLPPTVVEQLDAVICISEYQRQELLKACPWLNPAKVHQHWVGIDKDKSASAVAASPKVPKRVLYASSYDRGLAQLLEMWPEVRARVPEAELHVTYGWDFWKRSEAVVPQPVAESMRQERKRIEGLLKQPGVTHLGRIPHADVLKEFAEAEVWAYPCTGGELCCKTALEAQAAGCEPVVVPTMALAETVQCGSKIRPEEFIAALINTLKGSRLPGQAVAVLTPSWNDLAAWTWSLVESRTSPCGNSDVALVQTEETKLPERFAVPHCATEPPTKQLSILMAVQGMPFDGSTDKQRGLGGSETSALQLSREMVKRGHSVTVFSNLPDKPGKFDGVSYLPIQDFTRYAASTPHDVAIVQRDPGGFNLALRSKLNVLWCHDLGLRRFHNSFRASLWNVDYVAPVSHWHGRQLCDIYGLPPELIAPMRNGIDLDEIGKITRKKVTKDPNAVVFASRPERGLDLLLSSVFPRLLERNPNLTLYVCGYENTTEQMAPFYQHCQQLMANLGPRAKWLGGLKKADLYSLYASARAMLYPSRNFKEVSCLHGDTLIDMPRDYRRYPNGIPIKELVGKAGFPVYCYDQERHCITLGTVKWVKKTRKHAKVIKLTLDDGAQIIATPDHKIMLRDGTWREAGTLQPGTSLMPLYKSYRTFVNLNNSQNIDEARLVAEWKLNRALLPGECADHISTETRDNSPANIQVLDRVAHGKKIAEDMKKRNGGPMRSPIAAERLRIGLRLWAKTPAGKQHVQNHLGAVGGRASWARFASSAEKIEFSQQKERSRSAEANALRYKAGFAGNVDAQAKAIKNSHTVAHVARQSAYMRNGGSAKANSTRWNHLVVSVEPAGFADVYDMEVEKHHNFVAEGIVVHNCLTAMEAAACGLPFVSTTLGALPETIGQAEGFARLVEHPGQATPEFIERYVQAAWDVLSDDLLNKRMSDAGRNGAQAYSWAGVAREWEDFLLGAIDLRSKDKLRLARHWWRLGDIRGVEQVMPELTPEQVSHFVPIKTVAIEHLPLDIPDAPVETVINAMCQVIASLKPKTIVGLYEKDRATASTIAQLLGIEAVTDHEADVAVGVETLDCSEDPVLHIQNAEERVTPGGHICLVTALPGTHEDRLHNGRIKLKRWVFDGQDIKELLGKKQDLLTLVIQNGQVSSYDGSPVGWSLHCFKAGGTTGSLNMARRLWLQSPRLSMSGCMITKDAEGLLNRCLKSIEPYCDEIVVDDNGSTDSTFDIFRRRGIEPIVGSSPLEIGFDEARNRNIERASGDMILWIDSDEELLDVFNLPKYLRHSIYKGYAVQQHHFSAVPANCFKPDLPVRIFRRVGLDGKETGIRFWGRVHEHPEIEINHSVGDTVALFDVHIGHDGYLTESGRRKRFDRNIKLMHWDRATYPDRVLGKFLMLRDWIHLGRYEAEKHNALTPEASQYLEAAVRSFQENFLGVTHQMATDGLMYYNEALQLLGRGFEVQVVLKIGTLDGSPRELVYNGRVASRQDLEKLVGGSVKELASVWEGEYL